MALQESGEMYLETILILSRQKEAVHSVDVSDYMGFSKPSVSHAVGLLKEGGYIRMEKGGALFLTDAGRDVAEKIYERHRIIGGVLMALGVDEKTALTDACKIEHDISDATFDAIKKAAEKLG